MFDEPTFEEPFLPFDLAAKAALAFNCAGDAFLAIFPPAGAELLDTPALLAELDSDWSEEGVLLLGAVSHSLVSVSVTSNNFTRH